MGKLYGYMDELRIRNGDQANPAGAELQNRGSKIPITDMSLWRVTVPKRCCRSNAAYTASRATIRLDRHMTLSTPGESGDESYPSDRYPAYIARCQTKSKRFQVLHVQQSCHKYPEVALTLAGHIPLSKTSKTKTSVIAKWTSTQNPASHQDSGGRAWHDHSN